MKVEVQEQLILRLRDYINSNETTLVADERRNPVSEYWHPDRHHQELTTLFPKFPLVVAHDSQLTAIGSWVVDRLPMGDVLVVRLHDDELGAFTTTELADPDLFTTEPEALVARLARTRAGGAQPTLPSGIRRVQAESRHGLVWVLLDDAQTLDVAAFLGTELDEELTSYQMTGYALERNHQFTENLNWKSVIDGFLENYHVRFLHKDTLHQYLRSNVHTFDAFGPHVRLVVPKQSIERVLDKPVDEFEPLKYMNVVYQVFPNTVIGWVGDHFETWTSYPRRDTASVSETRFSILAPQGREHDHEFWDRSMKMVLAVIPAEDFEMSRLMQQGYAAMAQPFQVFGRNEGALQHFHHELEAVLGPAPMMAE